MTSGCHTTSRARSPRRSCVLVLCAVLVLHAGGVAAESQDTAAQSWTVTEGEVRIRCRLTIGGSFDVTTSAIFGTFGRSDSAATAHSGEFAVDLSTLDTGIELRNGHLRTQYLEIERGADYRRAVLSGIQLDAPMPEGADTYKTGFAGTLLLHGVTRTLAGEAELSRIAGGIHVEATFAVSLDEFEIPPPRYLGVGVRDEVDVTIDFDAIARMTPPGDVE